MFQNKELLLNTFAVLGLSKLALTSLEEVGYTEPTEIQAKSIGFICEGKDVLGSAQTGSGKTAAYVLPIIDRLQSPQPHTRALIIVPTRELALQVKDQVDLLGKRTRLRSVAIYGGTGYDKQIAGLRRGADIIIATPGRLNDLMERRFAKLDKCEMVVLDEADRLLDMGFLPQVRRIVATTPENRQTIMFSATIDRRVAQIAAEFLRTPTKVEANTNNIEAQSIEQKFHACHEFGKDALLINMLDTFEEGSVLVFTRTRRKATWVLNRLRDAKVSAEEIHGDISQNKRERTIAQYRKGAFRVLVATDIAARGLDIPAINYVVNYDLPQSAADYVHRIGRTGRAGRTGMAHSFVSEDQHVLALDIERLIGRKLTGDLPRPIKTSRPGNNRPRRFGGNNNNNNNRPSRAR